MESLDALYGIFPPTGKKEWLARLEKDLKDRSMSDLTWEPEAGLRIAPFYTEADQPLHRMPLTRKDNGNNWEVGEVLRATDPQRANQQALEAQEGGIQALAFSGLVSPDTQVFRQLLDGIDINGISVHLGGVTSSSDGLAVLSAFTDFLVESGLEPRTLKGTLGFDPLANSTPYAADEWRQVLEAGMQVLPSFRLIQVDGQGFSSAAGATTAELASLLAKGSEYLARLRALGFELPVVVPKMHFSVAIGSSYFLEIAKLRALRILWHNVLLGYGIANPEPMYISAHLTPDNQDAQVYTNMIRMPVQGMAAIIGGADGVFVAPADAGGHTHPDSFIRRIARNVPHLLRMESHIAQVADPGAGSYYIEALTDALCIRSWAGFIEMEQKRVFG